MRYQQVKFAAVIFLAGLLISLVAAMFSGVFNPSGTQAADTDNINSSFTAEKADPTQIASAQRNTVYKLEQPTPPTAGKAYLIKATKLGSTEKFTPVVQVFDTPEQARAAVPTSSIILGTLWDNAPPSGRSLTIYGPDCDYWGVTDLGAANFNDITSSLDNSCTGVTLYFDVNWAGPQQSYPNGRTNYVGDGMNDKASSVLFKPVYP